MLSPRLESYLDRDYARIRGMSSRFAARVVAHLMAAQAAAGITGGAAEIGTFEGRFFIAMGLSLAPGERLFGADSFDWPDDQVEQRLRANMAAMGVDVAAHTIWRGDSRILAPAEILAALGGKARIIHVDGDHTDGALTADLALAVQVVRPDGLIVLDDMLHPIYPLLILTVQRFLDAHPDWQVACVLDRESLSGAAKFVLARHDQAPRIAGWLEARLPAFMVAMRAQFAGHDAPIVAPAPELPKF
ncbi:class I SAM-dependent methyltransferase [Sediminicoccus sp. KRV36]|uniref:class I SAM-dependent methyltransferase n=1 Tax=Sediminicoccus sp. KRV36 TaxID=3133721 RepID=UPI00200C418D|nr:class I SAM-dependent methyltransferase [Sediminicoccus rosea]UPY35802.1 class I SAM-dependent methyltransferase [Sediminicoccus rosea]